MKMKVLHAILMYFVAAVLPGIFLFQLYNNNHDENSFVFSHVIVLFCVLGLASCMFFAALNWFIKSYEGSLIITLVAWVFFWFFGAIRWGLPNFIQETWLVQRMGSPILLGMMGVVLLSMIFVLKIYLPKLAMPGAVAAWISIGIVGLFVVNFVPAAGNQILMASGQAARLESYETGPVFKTEFVVDESLPTPDIYYFWMDGVVSFSTVEWFSGSDFSYQREWLEKNGFLIGDDWRLNGFNSRTAFATLFSPSLYDSFFADVFRRYEHLIGTDRRPAVASALIDVGLTFDDDILPNLEVFTAFEARGYRIDFPESTVAIYNAIRSGFEFGQYKEIKMGTIDRSLQQFLKGDLPELLEMTTPLRFDRLNNFHDTRISELINNEYSSQNHFTNEENNLPRFTFISNVYAHANRWYWQEPGSQRRDVLRVDLYPLAVEAALRSAITDVEEILSRNPNAIIILQGDHGFHFRETQNYLLEQGYPLEYVLRMMDSVFSAIRIPPEYGGLDEPLMPHNIMRELVNRFVGPNYDLLP